MAAASSERIPTKTASPTKIEATTAAAIHSRTASTNRSMQTHVARLTLRWLAGVRGRYPLARRETTAMRMKIGSSPIPVHTRIKKAYAHAGAVTNRKRCHVSAGAPVIAHTGGKSFAASWAAQIWTRSGGLEAKELVQASIEAWRLDHSPDRQQHSRRVCLAACGAVGYRQSLAGEPEDDLLVGDEAGQPHGVHCDVALLPA